MNDKEQSLFNEYKVQFPYPRLMMVQRGRVNHVANHWDHYLTGYRCACDLIIYTGDSKESDPSRPICSECIKLMKKAVLNE